MKLAEQLAELPAGFRRQQQDSQQTFRGVMNALARPGTVHKIVPTGLKAPLQMSPAMAAVSLAMPGSQTPVWLSETMRSDPQALAFITFHSGCNDVTDPTRATYAFVSEDDAPQCSLAQFPWGTDIEPHLGATLVIAVAGLVANNRGNFSDDLSRLQLSGPGIRSTAELAVAGLSDRFIRERAAAVDAFPRGVELLLCAGEQLVAIPRTTQVEVL